MPPKLTIKDVLPLPHTSVKIPRLGFGVYQSPASVATATCLSALSAGYRHIDSAQYYRNESEVGAAVAQCGLPRSSVFLTTKILSARGSVRASYQSALDSVHKMDPSPGGGYVDLFLIHTASGGLSARKEMWLALEQLHKEGKAKAIGVSNYGIAHIEEMKEYATVWPPMVNQIELHPWCQQRDAVAYCHENGIVVEAYSPLVRNKKAGDKTLLGVAERCGKTTQQVLVRYALQKDWVPLPKSDAPERIEANRDVFDFEIAEGDMQALDALDQGAKGAIVQAV